MSSINPVALKESQYTEICPISFETYEELAKKRDLVRAPCGHMFSQISLKNWMQVGHYDCPCCRRDMSSGNMIEVTLDIKKVVEPILVLPVRMPEKKNYDYFSFIKKTDQKRCVCIKAFANKIGEIGNISMKITKKKHSLKIHKSEGFKKFRKVDAVTAKLVKHHLKEMLGI